jgi:hypothetical protein
MDCPRCNGQAVLITRPDGKQSPFTEREEAWLRFTVWRLNPVMSSEYVS